MPSRPSIEDRLRQVQQLRHEPISDQLRLGISKALQDSSNLVIAEAAKLIRENELSGFEPELLKAWQRMLKDPLKSDKGCTAKTAIAETLAQLDYHETDFYFTGIAYHQLEPIWGGTQDTAEHVRGACAFAIAYSRLIPLVDKMVAFVDLLLDDKSALSPVFAIQALVNTGRDEVIPILRLKLFSEGSSVAVVGACMVGLLQLAPAKSVPLVTRFLESANEDLVMEAAAALGECGRSEAVEALIAAWKRTSNAEVRRSLLLSIGLSRESNALSFLISLIEQNTHDSEVAIEAMRPSCVYPDVRQRVREAVGQSGNRALQTAFEQRYPS